MAMAASLVAVQANVKLEDSSLLPFHLNATLILKPVAAVAAGVSRCNFLLEQPCCSMLLYVQHVEL